MARHLFLVNGNNPFSYGVTSIDESISRDVNMLYANTNNQYKDADNNYYNLVFIKDKYRRDFGLKYKNVNSTMVDLSTLYSAHYQYYIAGHYGVARPSGVKTIRVISMVVVVLVVMEVPKIMVMVVVVVVVVVVEYG